MLNEENEKRFNEIANRAVHPVGVQILNDVEFLVQLVKNQNEQMKAMGQEFDNRFANHKLIRSDLEGKLKRCNEDWSDLARQKKELQENLIKQQDLLEYYASKQPLKEYKEKAQIYAACLKRIASRSDWVGDDLRDNMIQNMAKDAMLTLEIDNKTK
jgi:hypothetical protein